MLAAIFCDSEWLGRRRKRAIIGSIITALFVIGPWAALLSFLKTHELNRHGKAGGFDWHNGSAFSTFLIIYVFLGCSCAVFQAYTQWLCSTFSNEPAILGRFSGYIEALRAAGLIAAFAIDSDSVPFSTEAKIYFSLIIGGSALSLLAAYKCTKDSKYGEEESVVIPEMFELN